MSEYNVMMESIKACRTHSQLLKVVEHIDKNRKELGFDEYQMEKLEAVGTTQYEKIMRDMTFMMKNRKK